MIIIFIASISLAFFCGYRCTKTKNKNVKMDEETKRKYKKVKESFDELMNYDYDKALGSDKR